MKIYMNIMIGSDSATALSSYGKEKLRKIVSKQLGIYKKDVEILIWEEPESVGHSIDVNGNCNKGCC